MNNQNEKQNDGRRAMPFIRIENVSFGYDSDDEEEYKNSPVIENLSLDIEEGSFVALLGHNGSGKSTLAKLLNLILVPDSGKIYIDGRDITDPDFSDGDILELRRDIGMVFQNPDNQLVATIVEEDIAFGPENMGVESSEIRRRVDDALKLVGMTEYAKASPHQLSGGQKQRIAIAGVIAMMPRCIVFDESTAMLDPSGRAEVMKTIKQLNRENGITVIHITHNMNEAIDADRVIVINDGKIVFDDIPTRVFSNVAALRSIGLDVPQVTELIYELRSSGIFDNEKLPQDIIDTEKCAEALAQLLK